MGPFQLSQASEHERKTVLLSKPHLPYSPGQGGGPGRDTGSEKRVVMAEGSCATDILKRTKNGVYYHLIWRGREGNPEFKSSFQVIKCQVRLFFQPFIHSYFIIFKNESIFPFILRFAVFTGPRVLGSSLLGRADLHHAFQCRHDPSPRRS